MLVTLLYCLLDTLFNAGRTLGEGITILKFLYLHPTALASGLGAAVLGAILSRRKAWISALAGFLGYNLFSLAWHFAVDLPLRVNPNDFYYLVLPFIFQALACILVGGGIGAFQRGREFTARFALAGALGFMVGWLIDRVLALIILNYFTLPQFQGAIVHLVIGSPWYFVYFLVPTLLYGILVGLGLGMAAAFKREKRQLALA